MKNALILLSITALLYSCSGNQKHVVEKTAHVYGNCEKCKATIEKAAKINGVKEAKWDVDSKLITYKIDTTVTSSKDLLQAIAAAGYDNEMFTGNDYEYQKLPACCQYERKDH